MGDHKKKNTTFAFHFPAVKEKYTIVFLLLFIVYFLYLLVYDFMSYNRLTL